MEDTKTIKEILDDIEEDYINFLNSWNKFIEDLKDDLTPNR